MYKQRQKPRKKINLGPTVIYDKSLKLDQYLDDKTRINLMANRSCYFSPDTKDFGQFTESSESTGQKSRTRRSEEIDSSIKCVKDILYSTLPREGKSSFIRGLRSVSPARDHAASPADGVYDNEVGSDIKFEEMLKQAVDENFSDMSISIKDVRISNEPRIKIVAEKFSRYKRNEVEIRKLEGRLVCVEYDVFLQRAREGARPVQVLRAYFSVAPASVANRGGTRTQGRREEDFKKKEMGIEIIDANIPQNKVYLEDLKRFLKRKQNHRDTNDRSPLNPKYLYNLAKKDVCNDISFTGLISKGELDEIKDFIMKKTHSSVYGINRRRLRPEKYSENDTGEDIIIEQILKFM